jgi:Tol biopolymer transport system component
MRRAWLWSVLAALGLAAPAHATFPGENGRIAYTWGRGGGAFEAGPNPRLVGVVSIRPDGGSRRLVARGGDSPKYSPGGRRIAFLRDHRLWVAQADGDDAVPVTPKGWPVGGHEWSPGGTRIAFGRGFKNGGDALYTVKPDGSGLRRLLKSPQPIIISSGPWSPDGKAIVYEQSSGRSLVRVFRAGVVTTLARPAGRPTWSRGGLVAYAAPVPAEGRVQVCITRPPRQTPIRCIGFADASVSRPIWSPLGDRLVVTYAGPGGGPAELWTVRPDGTVLTRTPKAEHTSPTFSPPIFSPDGGSVAFNRTRFAGDPALYYTDLLVQRPDGTGRRLLVRGGQAETQDWQPLHR